MTSCILQEENGSTRIALQGRLDSMTSPRVQQQIEELIAGGRRLLVADLSEVGFVSSAGLRVLMLAQKQLRKAGGEIILYGVPDGIMNVFTMSGFDSLFRMCSSAEQLAALIGTHQSAAPARQHEAGGIRFSVAQAAVKTGSCFAIGTQEKLAGSRYEFNDSIPVKQADIQFGAGLAAAGDEYEEYKELFGEAVVIRGSLFFYPAVKRPAVDFILCSLPDAAMKYRFFHGFGFNGRFAVTAAFEGADGFVSLDALAETLFTLTAASAIGIVLLAESKGLLGMNLKKVPIYENRPKNGLEIFDAANFPEWINFPIEPVDTNTVIAAAGIAVRSREGLAAKYEKLLPGRSLHHLHAGVFPRVPLSKNPAQLDAELTRVLADLEPAKVQHVLGQSKFSRGLVGIVELQG